MPGVAKREARLPSVLARLRTSHEHLGKGLTLGP